MANRMRVLKRFGFWHWWCPCCMGGDFAFEPDTATEARRLALLHIARYHG